MAWQETPAAVSAPILGDALHVKGRVFGLGHSGQVGQAVVQRVPVDVVDDLTRPYRVIGIGYVPDEVRAVDMATLVDSGPPAAFFQWKPTEVVGGYEAAPELTVLGTEPTLAGVDFRRHRTASVTAGSGTEPWHLRGGVDSGESRPAVAAVCGGFHTPQHSVERYL